MNMSSYSEEDSKYLKSRVNPILEKLTDDIVKSKPTDVVNFMVDWLIKKAGAQNTKAFKEYVTQKDKKDSSEEESEGSEDEIEDSKMKVLPKNKQQRYAVSAEAYGAHNKKSDYVPKVIEKDDDQKLRIRNKLEKAFMFQHLDEKEKEIVVNAMEEKVFKKGDWVIKQGEEGNVLYVVDKGELDCYKRFAKDEEPKHLKVYQPGESFGELALLYNVPRAASIRAKTDSILFALDRECFNSIVKDAAAKKRAKYEEFLARVPLLDTIDPYERLQIADGLKNVKFNKNDYVIKRGDPGDAFYIIVNGTAVATKKLNGDNDEVVFTYSKEGEYFGELALLSNEPRAANIIATSELSCVTLDRESFIRLLGPLKEILKRNMDKYVKYTFKEQ